MNFLCRGTSDHPVKIAQIQKQMLDKMREWINGTGSNRNETLHRLTSDMVKQGKNRRIGDTSTTSGHVHNQLLPEGGLQQVIAQQNIHVPGASVLNAGQDLMSGKMVSSNAFQSK